MVSNPEFYKRYPVTFEGQFHNLQNYVLRNPPIVGPWAGKIGRIYDLMWVPCAPEPELMIAAFWHDAPYILSEFIKPDPEDFLISKFGRPHRTGPIRRVDAGNPEEPAIKVPKNKLAWAAWQGVKMKEKLGAYFIVIDGTLDFGINWTSTVLQFSGCNDPNEGYGQSQISGGVWGPSPDDWVQITVWSAIGHKSPVFATPTSMEIAGNHRHQVTASMKMTPYDVGVDPATGFDFEVRDMSSGRTVASGSGTYNSGTGQYETADLYRVWEAGGSTYRYSVFVKIYGGWCRFLGSRFNAYTAAGHNILGDP